MLGPVLGIALGSRIPNMCLRLLGRTCMGVLDRLACMHRLKDMSDQHGLMSHTE